MHLKCKISCGIICIVTYIRQCHQQIIRNTYTYISIRFFNVIYLIFITMQYYDGTALGTNLTDGIFYRIILNIEPKRCFTILKCIPRFRSSRKSFFFIIRGFFLEFMPILCNSVNNNFIPADASGTPRLHQTDNGIVSPWKL